ncbi:endo alpha-1,4 polygalactosaminidase [Nocardiopsis sediminis]|uniref:Endo alpha-1,4 polygalactosaminidase n=1 Tax=Nocardiopsis sediminis TaxID=1778267 RepID=A0ABV8FSS9_9ACTN
MKPMRALRATPLAALLLLAACAAPGPSPAESAQPVSSGAAAQTPPPERAAFDYQIGGAYTPPDGVEVVIRDREADPADGLYSICYVNGFQVQPAELDWWQEEHPGLLLRDADGDLVIDPDWDEAIIDISTEDKRAAAAGIVGDWMAGCAASGLDAVELDNLDSFSRSQSLLTADHALAFGELLTDRAHAEGLAAGQKNAAEMIDEAGGPVAGFDFAVAEECGRWDECGVYADAYPNRVLDVEYREQDMDTACAAEADGVSVVLRDLMVTTPGSPDYVYATCADLG